MGVCHTPACLFFAVGSPGGDPDEGRRSVQTIHSKEEAI